MNRKILFLPNSHLENYSSILPGLRRAPGRWLPVALPVIVPGTLCGMSHDFFVTHDIFLQETSCTVCLETRATALQVTLGAFLPFVSSLAGTLLLGQQMNFKWVPRSRNGSQHSQHWKLKLKVLINQYFQDFSVSARTLLVRALPCWQVLPSSRW